MKLILLEVGGRRIGSVTSPTTHDLAYQLRFDILTITDVPHHGQMLKIVVCLE